MSHVVIGDKPLLYLGRDAILSLQLYSFNIDELLMLLFHSSI